MLHDPPRTGDRRSRLRGYVDASGGPRGISSGIGSMGRGGAAQRVAASLAAFANAVGESGLPAALDRFGFGDLVGRPVAEVLDALVDRLGGPANSLDDVDARNALSRLREDMFDTIATPEDLEAALVGVINGDALGDLLSRFFALCLFEQFTRVFYERLVARVGEATAASFLDGIRDYIRDYIRSAVASVHITRDLRMIDWSSAVGRELADRILEDTLFVFAGGP
jgi:hypothetical protein